MKFVNILLDKIKNLDTKIVKIMNTGIIFSFIITLISVATLITYEAFYSLPSLFYIGISLFRTALTFGIMFFICAIGFDTVQKEIS